MNTIINEIWTSPLGKVTYFENGHIKYRYHDEILTGIYEDIKVTHVVYPTSTMNDKISFETWFRKSIKDIETSILKERIIKVFNDGKNKTYGGNSIYISELSLKIQVMDSSRVLAYNTINNQILGEFLLFKNDLKKMINSILIKNILTL